MKAERVVYDQVKHRIRFTDATLDLFGVPVLYTPVLTEPDPTVQYASGLLAPDVGNSTKIGYFARAAGLYRAVADQRPDRGAAILHPGRRTAGGRISRALEQWRHVAAGLASPTIPMAGWAAAPERRSMTICSAPAASRSNDTLARRLRRQLTNNTPICASTTSPISTGW